MSEEEVGVEFLGDSLVLGKFPAVVRRQRMNAGRKGRQQGNHAARDCLPCLEPDVGNQRVARNALVDRDECLLLSGADDQIRFPVTEARAVADDGRTFVNRDLVGNCPPSVTAPIPLLPGLLAAQGEVQGAASSLVGVYALVDGFVADSGLPVDLEVTGDLFRTPGLGKFGIDHRPCLGSNARAVLTCQQPGLVERMCLLWPVASLSAISPHLTAYG